jgi:hypothetical protein
MLLLCIPLTSSLFAWKHYALFWRYAITEETVLKFCMRFTVHSSSEVNIYDACNVDQGTTEALGLCICAEVNSSLNNTARV